MYRYMYRGLKVLTRSNFTNFKGVPHPLYQPRGGCFCNIKNPIGKTYFLFHVSGVEMYVKITTKSMYKRSRNNLYCSKNQNTIWGYGRNIDFSLNNSDHYKTQPNTSNNNKGISQRQLCCGLFCISEFFY